MYRVNWFIDPSYMLPSKTMAYFIQMLSQDPTNQDTWNMLFDNVGTHYWTELDLGGMLSQESKATTRNSTRMKDTKINFGVNANVAFTNSTGNAGGSADINTDNYDFNTWQEYTMTANVQSVGGNPGMSN